MPASARVLLTQQLISLGAGPCHKLRTLPPCYDSLIHYSLYVMLHHALSTAREDTSFWGTGELTMVKNNPYIGLIRSE